jgi:hypothetical protein
MDTNKLIPLLSDMAIFVTVVEQGEFNKAAKKTWGYTLCSEPSN